MSKHIPAIPTPSPSQIDMYSDEWKALENYVLQERSLNKLFMKTYPHNTDIEDILIKVCSLNDFYSTNIFYPYKLAQHILKLEIDGRLLSSDDTLVNDIAVGHGIGNNINLYSFATKYCSHHKPESYPIYDSYVERMLLYFRNATNFFDFDKEDLKHFPKYKGILKGFMGYYGLEAYTLKDIDRYLWQAGKIYFRKTYSKKTKGVAQGITVQGQKAITPQRTKTSEILELHKAGKTNKEIAEAGFNKSTVGVQVSKYKRSLLKIND